MVQIYATDCRFQNKNSNQILLNNINLIVNDIAEFNFIIIIAALKI
jgi:hypothetical protein